MSEDADRLIPVFMPSLVTLLAHHEREKGSPLTEDEVIAIRDHGVCMMLRESMAHEMAEKRGYYDIEPGNVWEEWQVVRETLADGHSEA